MFLVLTLPAGTKRDQAAVLAALTYSWSQGQIHRLKLLKANPMYGLDLSCYGTASLLDLLELSTEDVGDPNF